MAGKFTVSLGKIIDEFHLETIYMPAPPEEILVYFAAPRACGWR